MDRVLHIKRLVVAFAVLAACWLSFPRAFADKFNTEASSSARALGMGGVGVNTERGPYAVFYNPANIAAKETHTNIQLLNMQMEVTDGWLSRTGAGNYSNFNDLQALHGDLKNNKNTYVGGRFSLFPNVTIRNFSIGMLYEVNQGAEYRAYDNALRVRARDRFGPVSALSFRLFNGILRFGASVEMLTVGYADTFIRQPIVESNLDFAKSINSATGISKNAGMTLTLPFRFLPSFSVVARDIGGTKYSGARFVEWGDGRTVPTEDMTFDFGTSLTVYVAKRLEMKLAMDYRDTVNKLQGQNFRHIFAGGELIFYDVLKFRMGVGHGYMSYGIGINTSKANLDLAAYADEKDDRLRGSKDQRYVLQYTWSIFK